MEYILESMGAERITDDLYVFHLSNGKILEAERLSHDDGDYDLWEIGNTPLADMGEVSVCRRVVERIVQEQYTGQRIIPRKKGKIPEICGIEGRACRAKGECNRALCMWCPVADKFFADRDGVELVYAISGEEESK